jgi:hypothetical protein
VSAALQWVSLLPKHLESIVPSVNLFQSYINRIWTRSLLFFKVHLLLSFSIPERLGNARRTVRLLQPPRPNPSLHAVEDQLFNIICTIVESKCLKIFESKLRIIAELVLQNPVRRIYLRLVDYLSISSNPSQNAVRLRQIPREMQWHECGGASKGMGKLY